MGLGIGEGCADAEVVRAPGAANVSLSGRGMGSGPCEIVRKQLREGMWDVIRWAEHDRVERGIHPIGGVTEYVSCSAVV